MSFIEWEHTVKVDVHEIDEQHEKLIGLLNDLHQAMKSNQGEDALNSALPALIEYTRLHFAAEERLMTEAEYPDYERHKFEHDRLLAQLVNMERRVQSGEFVLTVSVMLDLHDWATGHIAGSDRPLGAFLKGG